LSAYPADHVGSLLRPDYLLRAREAGVRGRGLTELEDRAVDEAIAVQEHTGVDIVTDGEQRRNVFASHLAQSCDGFEHVEGSTVDWFTLDGEVEESPVTVAVTSRMVRRRSLAGEELAYLRARTDRPKKATVPSPTMYAYYWLPRVSSAAYPSSAAFLDHVTELLRDDVRELVALGADYVQVDAPELGMLIDPHQRGWFEAKGFDPDRLIEEAPERVAAVLDGVEVTTGLHICRGNDANRYMARGGYEAIASRIFPRVPVERLLLEYDDERSGGFEPLRHVPDETVVVLGIVSTKRAALEDPAELRARIAEAARIVPLERLALSPQCGFASVAEGNDLTAEAQEQKLRLVVRVAREVWPSDA
jgi:5-methyltetrahydropteroyltriglutamate--homocysteine methyltransferase